MVSPYEVFNRLELEVLKEQAMAEHFNVFVAMQFEEPQTKKDRKDRIVNFISNACESIGDVSDSQRKIFEAKPVNISSADEITNAILERIFKSHIFVADLTHKNPNVMLELGIAMSFKPLSEVILISENLEDLGFDVKTNNILGITDEQNDIKKLANALKDAGEAFNQRLEAISVGLRKRLSPDALLLLREYAVGHIQDQARGYCLGIVLNKLENQSLQNYLALMSASRLDLAYHELLQKKLIYLDHTPEIGGDHVGLHATELGWFFINRIWGLDKPDKAKTEHYR